MHLIDYSKHLHVKVNNDSWAFCSHKAFGLLKSCDIVDFLSASLAKTQTEEIRCYLRRKSSLVRKLKEWSYIFETANYSKNSVVMAANFPKHP